MFSNAINTKRQGDVGMAAAIFYYVQSGYTVSVPLTDCQQYDIIVERDGLMERVQVKTTTRRDKQGVYTVELRTIGGRHTTTRKKFDNKAVERVFVLCENGDRYDLPSEVIDAQSAFRLGETKQPYRV